MKKLLPFLLAFVYHVAGAQDLNIVFRSQLSYPGQTLANIWGHVDSLGNEYALVGASKGLSIVNVTDPDNIFEVAQIPGPDNLWKEIKTWNGFAYITTEAAGVQGLQIVDLRDLPGTNLPDKYWSPEINGDFLTTIHALHIDKGFAYLYGSNISPGGAIIADLTDPWNPTVAGAFNQSYIHDGMVRNDTLFGGHIYDGYFSVVDVSDKANPVVLATQNTPNNFTHNTWLSDNGKTLFTTDETANSYLTAYDITDLTDIKELDRYQSNPGSNSIVHNTYILNDYAVTSWYRDGVVIVDAHRPNNLVAVGNYDTYAGTGNGFDGAWGVYPYLPSGNLIVSNIDEGLFVLSPTYVRAAYLEGTITNLNTGAPVSGASVEFSTANKEIADISGVYRTGTGVAGTYSIIVSKPGYKTKVIDGVVLTSAQVTVLDVQLEPLSSVTVTGSVSEVGSAMAIPGALVKIYNAEFTYTGSTDNSGNFSIPSVFEGDYSIVAGKWGYVTKCQTSATFNTSNTSVQMLLDSGIYDDFTLDFGWTINGNATTGMWERAKPVGTYLSANTAVNPPNDVNDDCSEEAFVTGNKGQTTSDDDIDNGSTTITSPVFDLTGFEEPYISYSRWFYNGGGGGSTVNDSLIIKLSNGITTANVEIVRSVNLPMSAWVNKVIRVSSVITPTANMRVIVRSADAGSQHIVEAGFDKFQIMDSTAFVGIAETKEGQIYLSAFPNPFNNEVKLEYKAKNNIEDGTLLVITDVLGRTVKQLNISGLRGTITLGADLLPGVYNVVLNHKNQSQQGIKIVKTN